MGQAIACCSGDSDRFQFTASNTTNEIKIQYFELENNLRPKFQLKLLNFIIANSKSNKLLEVLFLNVYQHYTILLYYPVRGCGAIFVSRESLPNVDDKYIMKQQKSMSRAHQNKSAGSPTKDGVPDGDSYQPKYDGYNSGSISNGTRV